MSQEPSPATYDRAKAIAEDVIREDIKACMKGLAHPNLEWSKAVQLAGDFIALVTTRSETPQKPIDPESEAANPVWDLVIQTCAQAWPAGLLTWSQSPTELIVKIINERDELRHDLERAMANHNADLNGTTVSATRLMTWIPVGERLPEMKPMWADGPKSSARVIACIESGAVVVAHMEETYQRRTLKWKGPNGEIKATHWMPLPEKP